MIRPRSTALLAMACCLLAHPDAGRAVAAPPNQASVGEIKAITDPMTRQVVQRRDDNIGNILFIGTCSGNIDGFQAMSSLPFGMTGTTVAWTPLIDVAILEGHFIGIFRQPAGGFYNLQIRPTFQGQVGQAVNVSTVGVGEVFITAGQSNTTNFGTPTGFLPSLLVSCFDDGSGRGIDPTYPGAFWRWGYDPQPAIDMSNMGSVWPTMATNLSNVLGVPVGLYAAGFGGTSIEDWTPGYVLPATLVTPELVLFDRLTNAIEYFSGRGGFRAILWQQGETDYYEQTSELVYGADLRFIIDQSRAVTGVPVKWMVAQASTCLTNNLGERLQIEAAQASVVDYNLTFPGPNSDSIGLPLRIYYEGIPVHFNATGLVLLGGYWGLYVASIPNFLAPGHLPPP
jgi:Carbohydrate esterase, sialic acid-specific acetylesterase